MVYLSMAGLTNLRHTTRPPPSKGEESTTPSDVACERNRSDLKFKPIWQSIIYDLNKFHYYPERHPDPIECCAVSGNAGSEKAHICPVSKRNSFNQETWMEICGVLPKDPTARRNAKTSHINRMPLTYLWARKMEPGIGGFTLFPTTKTLLQLIYLAEKRLLEAERSPNSFYGFRAEEFYKDWDEKHEVGGHSINVFEYDAQFWPDGVLPPKVEQHYKSGVITYNSILQPKDPKTYPEQFRPQIAPVLLPLDPLIVVCISQYSVRRRRDDERKVRFNIRDAEKERIFKLGEYLLRLCEVSTPSSFRMFKRPQMLEPLQEQPEERNRTNRWVAIPACQEAQVIDDDEPRVDDPSSSTTNSSDANRTRLGGPYASDSSEEPEVRRSKRLKSKQKADEETASTSSASVGVPSPDLSNSGDSTPSERSVEWSPPMRVSPFQFEDHSSDDSCTPPVIELRNPFATLEQWRDHTNKRVDAFVEQAVAPFRKDLSEDSLMRLRQTYSLEDEAEIQKIYDLIRYIDGQIARAAEGSDEDYML